MKRLMQFALLPIDSLRPHEQFDPDKAEEVRKEIERTGQVTDPVWVSRQDRVILNGHHRVEALRALGAVKIPAFLVDYSDESITLERWRPGPPIRKQEVLDRARRGELFPPKTTRHGVAGPTPVRITPLAALLASPGRSTGAGHPVAPRGSRGGVRSAGGGV